MSLEARGEQKVGSEESFCGGAPGVPVGKEDKVAPGREPGPCGEQAPCRQAHRVAVGTDQLNQA